MGSLGEGGEPESDGTFAEYNLCTRFEDRTIVLSDKKIVISNNNLIFILFFSAGVILQAQEKITLMKCMEQAKAYAQVLKIQNETKEQALQKIQDNAAAD